MSEENGAAEVPAVERQTMEVDIACVGFGPAMGGFLTTLAKGLTREDGTPVAESAVSPGMPPQVVCYERADGLGFGVSGVVTKGRGIKQSFPDLDPAQIPMATRVKEEKVVYLLDPHGASRRSATLKAADAAIKTMKFMLPYRDLAVELPYTPDFLQKHGGFVLSIGQFNQWVGEQLMAGGQVQIWPGTPVGEPLLDGDKVVGIRLLDQGVKKDGTPDAGYMPGLDVKARLTVVADGPVGAVGRALDQRFGLPGGHHQREWAVGMKMVVDLPESCTLPEGTVFHTLGYPEPEIFGFLYVHPGRVASVGVFVPSWFDSPIRTSYLYLQHYVQHPYLWKHLAGGKMRSWGAKSLQESGRRGEPHLVGEGFARIGEGSGSTNVLTGSGVDEAWTTGMQLAEGVLELLRDHKPFTRENLEAAYVGRRRGSWVEAEGRVAEKARDGFGAGVVTGLLGMALSGMTKGLINIGPEPVAPHERLGSIESYYAGRIPADEIARLRDECKASGKSLHAALMKRAGWPDVELDGQLLVTHQDALLMGGKVQAAAGYADHVVFLQPAVCENCGTKTCIEICSAQAIAPGEAGGTPAFDREKCVHCGACLWNCTQALEGEVTNISFRAGAGGLHSAEN
ncbi:MAG TPA: 4Fe-4S ferredoxin [Anaeromyxobacteraceae bacterium]|nr:4Fe-4S ferredoxin [Anaeromyxobacteraceae bacterium]